MAKIRQEVNILNAVLSATTGNSATSSENVRLWATRYPGATFYFEVVVQTSASIATSVSLRRVGTTTDDATVTVPLGTTSYTRIRSAAFTPVLISTGQDYCVFIANTAGATKNVKAARIVIIQDSGYNPVITNTHIQLAGNQSVTTATLQPLTAVQYFKYDASKWLMGAAGTYTSAVLAVCIGSPSTKVTATCQLEVDDGAFGGWTAVTDGSATSTQPTAITLSGLGGSNSVVLVDGRNYRVTFSTSNSKSAISVFGVHLVICQREGGFEWSSGTSNSILGATGTNEMFAQEFSLTTADTVVGVGLALKKTGSPADDVIIELVSAVDGAALASATLAASTLTTTPTRYAVTFGSSYAVSASTVYFIRLSRSGARDLANHSDWMTPGGDVDPGSGLSQWSRNSGVWSASSSTDQGMDILGATGITKLEAQYLVANSTISGTALQDFKQLWDSTEWDVVTNTYVHEADSVASGTSDVKLQDTTGPADLTGSTITDVIQREQSGSVTMPTSGHDFDVIATTNNSDLWCSRLLAQVVVGTPTPPAVAETGGSTLLSMGVG